MSADKLALLRRYDALRREYAELVVRQGACYCDHDELNCMAHGHAGRRLEAAAKLLIGDVETCQ